MEIAALPFACGLELLHGASLALDDLPSMDNAPSRRGKPCYHLVFPPWVVALVPPYLVNMAYQMGSDSPLAEGRGLEALRLLGAMAADLARGQELDLTLDAATATEAALLECYALKSGALFAAALAGGGLLGGAGAADTRALREAGLMLGQAFQILDDLSDGPQADRCTVVTRLGSGPARARADGLLEGVFGKLDRFGPAADELRGVIGQVREQ
jgi:geranylgeranyl diphosphate synthase type II